MKQANSIEEVLLLMSELEQRIEALENKASRRTGVVLTGSNSKHVDYFTSKKHDLERKKRQYGDDK